MIRKVRRIVSMLVPNSVKRRVRGNASAIRELRAEVDELRGDQRRVAELMDVVEQLALAQRTHAKPSNENLH